MRTLAVLTVAMTSSAIGCGSNDCGESGWDRFVATLEQRPPPACTETPAGPSATPQASTGSVGRCTSASANDPCVACVAASCCAETLACTDEPACACLLTCRGGGAGAVACSVPSSCGTAPDAAFATAMACITIHCASQCPRLQ